MRITVVITTYNRPDALAAVLESYIVQSDREFEIIVADDGSGEETAAVVNHYKNRGDAVISHIWQEDKGFRAGTIRNRALSLTGSEYVIFTDGDCIPLSNFIKEHRRLAEHGWFVAGNRILLSKALTNRIIKEKLPVHMWPVNKWFLLSLKGDVNRWLPLCNISVPELMRKIPRRSWQGVMTCNLAAWRDDLLTVNGFDETYSGWGLEDSDLVIRLLHAGLHHKSARFAAPVLHLWHQENEQTALSVNRQRLDNTIRSKQIWAERGVRDHL